MTAGAADFPTKPIRIIVSESAGAGSDILARQVGSMLTDAWGYPVVIDGRPGASGLIGAEAAAKSPPDGYTLWVTSTSQLVGTILFQRYLLAEEFTPVTRVAATTSIIAVNASLPINSMAEFLAYAKARPGQMMYGSAGQATSMNLCMIMLRMMTGIDVVHVPYKAAATMLSDLAGGHLQVACAPAAPLQPFAKSGRIRLLAVTNLNRRALAPGLPAVNETVPGFETAGWYGLVAPLGTPDDIVMQINAVINKALKTPAIQERLNAMALDADGSTPAEFAAFLKMQTAKWKKMLQDANIRPE
jgi:tripartite-type tricarboxylate transporter receptor subunit TctC